MAARAGDRGDAVLERLAEASRTERGNSGSSSSSSTRAFRNVS